LLPLGDPPLLVGYIMGVPFFWTLHLLPIWLLYVSSFLVAFYVMDARAYAKETRVALAADRSEVKPWSLLGRRNLLFLVAIVPAALLPDGWRELALLTVALLSFFTTPRAVHEANAFGFGPIIEVAIIFAGGNGYLDDVKVEDIRRFEAEFMKYLDNNKASLLDGIREKRELNDDLKGQLKTALEEFKRLFKSA